MDNMTNIISSHDKKINSYNETNGKTYNCPLDNKCLTDKIIYKAEVETNDGINDYLQKFILVSARQNLSPVSTTIQCHLETGHTKMTPNFRNIFGI